MKSPRRVLRATLALLLAALGAGALGVARDGAGIRRFGLRRLWSWDGADELRRVQVGRRGRQVGSFLAVAAGAQVTVLDALGRPLRAGHTAGLALVETADVDGDGDDEIAASEWIEKPPVQLYDETLQPLGPNVSMLDMGLPATLRAFDLDGDGRRELLLGDFRGCVAALAYPRFLWDHCLTPGGGESGDASAARWLALVRAPSGERLLTVSCDSGETVALDARGRRRWRFEAGVDGLVDALALDLDGDGADELLLATRNHGTLVLDASGQRRRTRRVPEHSPAAVAIEWDGDPRTRELLVASGSGSVTLVAAGLTLGGGRAVDQQIHALAAADLDGDGRDEVLAALATRELSLLARVGGGWREFERLAADGPVAFLRAFVGSDGRPAFAVAVGRRLHALGATFTPAPRWYSPLNATIAATLLVALAGLALLRLAPPWPREDQGAPE